MKLLSVFKNEPVVRQLAMVAKYVVFPASMVASVIYSPPDYLNRKKSITSPN